MDAATVNRIANYLPGRLANSNNHDDLRRELLSEGITGGQVGTAFTLHGDMTWNYLIWVQSDFRGAKFVRLNGGSGEPSIAMVEFESFETGYKVSRLILHCYEIEKTVVG